MSDHSDVEPRAVRVWDLPTRLFHWALTLSLPALLISGRIGGGAMDWHLRVGLAVGALLLFRLAWGLAGGRWSRFASWPAGPAALGRYLRGRPAQGDNFGVGHNPLGSWSVLTALALLLLQVASGLVADDEISVSGPLNRHVSGHSASLATHWHTTWGQWLLLAWAGLHLAALAWHRWRHGQRLVRAMISGDKLLPRGTPASADGPRQRIAALLLALICAGLVGRQGA